MARHFFFDLDKTLTPSRSLMLPEHQAVFERLCKERDVVVVSGAEIRQMQSQLPASLAGLFYILAQNGNHAIDKSGTELWREELTSARKSAILAFAENVKRELALFVKDENDLIEDRGAQISYSLIGHHEDLAKKNAFDPDAHLRLDILARHAADVEELKQKGVEVKTGGTTTLDFFSWGMHKGYNISRFIEKMGWEKEDCIYVGDALFPGG
ncbi:HAD-IIB family hydrolase, partial [Candidatus Kaiserbacteria bacterium]|nr:HAD-IIB family hydrolase [Candidatus Kaiserbacteria bacterium]